MKAVPQKLKHDAIVEAVFEMRFETSTIPELLFGRLADYGAWANFEQKRLPAYEVPAPLRDNDPNLKYQAFFELFSERRRVRIGPHAISYHRLQPYVGWDSFKSELVETIGALFEKARNVRIERLGLRYLNALRSDVHGVASLAGLNLGIAVASAPVHSRANLNFVTEVTPNTVCTTRIATPEFVQGHLPNNTTVYVDVDVATVEGFTASKREEVEAWLEAAHGHEKQHFFRLLTDQTIEALEEK